MRKEKNLAVQLRKKGNSYSQISQKLKIPKSTLSCWLSDLKISTKARERILARSHKKSVLALIKRNKKQTSLAKERADEIRLKAKKEAARLMDNKLFLVGVSLYWAEGYKKGAYGSKWKSVDFVNSDPELIKIMMKFFKIICQTPKEKFRPQLIAHKNINIGKALDYWSKLTKLNKKQFVKTCTSVSKHSKGKRNVNTLTKGTLHIRINDVKLFFRIIGWIDGLKLNI